MSLVLLKFDLGPGFGLFSIGIALLRQPWLWILVAIAAYFAFELIRARRRRKSQEDANRSRDSE